MTEGPSRRYPLPSRRAFLQSALAAGAAAMVDMRLFRDAAIAGPQLAANGRILVLVELNGGLDSLNTVVPFGDPAYAVQRAPLALPSDSLLRINGDVGLHPGLSRLKTRYDNGDVAIVRGVGMPDGNRSHFNAMARLMAANPGEQLPVTGWAGRYLDSLGDLGGLGGISIENTGVPLILRGNTDTTTNLPLAANGIAGGDRTQAHWNACYDWMQQLEGRRWGANAHYADMADMIGHSVTVARDILPLYDATPQMSSGLAQGLAVAASVINLDVGARILHVYRIGFDTHVNAAAPLDALLRELDDAIEGFFQVLHPQFHSRTVLATITEFGRRVRPNGGLGTDHGTSSVMFLVGNRVNGGLHGTQPSLTQLDARGDMAVTVDIRSVFATIVEDWLDGDEAVVLGATYPHLPLFQFGAQCPPLPSSFSSNGYRALVPTRVLDTRLGVGAARAKLGPGQTVVVDLAGRGGIPGSGVKAVALNVTAAEPDRPSYLTVWPADRPRPATSNLNLTPGLVTPNMVITGVDGAGRIALYNEQGSVHVIADVAGWLPADSAYVSVNPERVLDTRSGIWAPRARLGAGQTLRMTLAGRAGIGPSAQAVVLNLTAVDSDANGYVTVWPSGTPRPHASSLNTARGRAVPNLVIARLGADGAVDLYNFGGATHLIADVFGWFPAGAGFHPLSPSRVLDTRAGITARGALRARMRLDVEATCKGGVPPNAAAVALNVTVTEPTAASYLSIWPAGSPQPTASNLNFAAGQTVPNLVICRLGVDGMVSFFNAAGAVHAVADVVGWFE
jgi:uncharacterized protein (DUF1501 family)